MLEFINDATRQTIRIYDEMATAPLIPRVGERIVVAELYETYDVKFVMHTFHDGEHDLTQHIGVYVVPVAD
jgi:hypothetical protein